MLDPRKFEGWENLELQDLVLAYRKAKADAFFERIPGAASRFARYERNIVGNLEKLLESLKKREPFRNGSLKHQEGEDVWGDNPNNLFGELTFFPKKTNLNIKSKNFSESLLLTSDPDKQEHHITGLYELTPSFRVSSLLPVETHIISALWVNMIGHKLDAKLGRCAYGSRLRRLRGDGALPDGERPYHATATGMFAPYWQYYREWRDEGLRAIRRLLKIGQPVVAYNFDLKSYYHNIDPGFLLDNKFLEKQFGIVFDKYEIAFNEEIVEFIYNWQNFISATIGGKRKKKSNESQNKSRSRKMSNKNGNFDCAICPTGIPIGLAATRLMANVLLGPWDRYVEDMIRPEFYGRYVDDMIMVVRGTRRIRDAETALKCLRKSLGDVLVSEEGPRNDAKPVSEDSPEHPREEIWRIRLDRIPGLKDPCLDESRQVSDRHSQDGQGESETSTSPKWVENTRLILQPGKQRIFILEGSAGEDVLNVIEQEIAQLSSEFRLMPSVEELSRTKAARLLVSAGQAGEQADRLGHVNATTIHRLGWALTLRKAEMIARDLPAKEWQNERKELYAFSRHHVLRADRFLDFFRYLPRLLGLAVQLGDWSALENIVDQVARALTLLRKHASGIELNGKYFSCANSINEEIDIDWIFDNVNKLVARIIIECILRNLSYYFLEDSIVPVCWNITGEAYNAIERLINRHDTLFHEYTRMKDNNNAKKKNITIDDLTKITTYGPFETAYVPRSTFLIANELTPHRVISILTADLAAVPLCEALMAYDKFREWLLPGSEGGANNSDDDDSNEGDLYIDHSDKGLKSAIEEMGLNINLIEGFLKIIQSQKSNISSPIETANEDTCQIGENTSRIPTGIVFPTRPFKADEVAEILMRHYVGTLGKCAPARQRAAEDSAHASRVSGEGGADGTGAEETADGLPPSSAGMAPDGAGKGSPDESKDCSLKEWGDYVRALRGTWIRPPGRQGKMVEQLGARPLGPLYCVPVGTKHRKKVILGLTNVQTSEKAWRHAACGNPLLSAHRYAQIARVVNDALRCNPPPDYLLFHELCLPRRWLRTIRGLLSARRINLIAGVEYHILQGKQGNRGPWVANEVHLALIDDRLGYDVCLPLWISKREPALEEKAELEQSFRLQWHAPHAHRIVYNHDGFFFSVLICSELLRIRDRALLQGAVDALIVPSWNRDLATFSALVEAAALDVHCYVALVNNRSYGDSRVRVPAKMRHRRDLARLRGGNNDYLVCVELDIAELRQFQSRATRFAKEGDPFKPVPDGFEILPERKILPPK